jgi:proteic killer suppression protein
LVFAPQEVPIPTNDHGQYVWIEITGIEIIEVVNYHKEK